MIQGDDPFAPWPASAPSAGVERSGVPERAEGGEGELIERVSREVIRHPSRSDQIRLVHDQPARDAQFRPLPARLHPRWRPYLERHGIRELYSHQAEAIDLALDGENVLVVTGTASGKTLCYNMPVLDGFMTREAVPSESVGDADARPAPQRPGGYALYLFPTKALAQDQMRVLSQMLSELELGIEAGVFDGDTPPPMRRKLRQRGRLILTNPDMLHQSILPHHGGWAGLFAGLEWIVVDEIHSLRGIFGSNVACVLRRLRRIAAHYGARPRFLCASATVANPQEHAQRLLGEPVRVVSQDGAPSGAKRFVLWNPPLFRRPDGSQGRKGPVSVATRVLPDLLRRGVRTICFAGARNTVELILRYTWDRLKSNRTTRPLAAKLEAYRGGYLPQERREIEGRLFRGDLLGVVSTNALELGIDIGGLDACLLVGYPGSVASFLQRSGRAGRRAQSSLVVYIASQAPIDQYFMRHPETFFERSPERAIIESENPYILTKHLICAAYELPLGEDDAAYFGDDLGGILRLLAEADRLREADGKWYHSDRDFPAKRVRLRTVGEENFTIYELNEAKIVGELDYVAALLSLYEGAVYIHRSETAVVEELDVENQIARIRKQDTGYYTQALEQKRVTVDEEVESAEWRIARLSVGDITVETRITGFKKVRFHTVENIGYGDVELPPIVLETVSLWLDLPDDLVEVAMQYGADFFHSGIQGIGRVFSQLMPFFVMADPGDVDYFIDGRRIYVYDLYQGGIGYAEKGHEIFETVLEATLEHTVECECDAGCPSCVLPASSRYEIHSESNVLEYPFPKEATRFLLHALLEKEPYKPRLEPTELGAPHRAVEPHVELDPKVARKVRRALRNI